MALRKAYRFRWQPSGVCDSLDGNNGIPGAMLSLSNLIPDPTTNNSFVPRPAAVSLSTFPGFTTPGFQSGSLVIGNILYGTIASGRNAGKDEPFAYNLVTNTFLTVSGITNANTPSSPPATGDWTPPILAQVGSRIIVTHPGFPGGAVKFGWFDIGGFAETTTGNTNTSVTITGNPNIFGVEPGMTISDGGVNIPANTSVVSTAQVTITTIGTSHSNTTIDGIPSTAGMAVGQIVTGSTLGIPLNTTIASVVGINSITISNAATLSATGAIQVAGATITMSAAATGSTNSETLTIAGGTATAPQWSAGDTNINPLPSVPLGVAQMNGRAYFACGVNGVPFSDSLLPCQRTNANQALTTDDGLATTAVAPLTLQAPLTGGIVQAILVFEGVAKMQQITGDQATNNLAMNAMNVATGTLAPLSITQTNFGTAFISPQGLRIVNYSGSISDPIGDHGTGISIPFIYAQFPSRICAASTADTLRISVNNSIVGGFQEWWFDITRKIWTGPHNFPASLIQQWQDTFVMSAVGINAKLWQSDAIQSSISVYVENGNQLSFGYQTALLPDDQDMMMIAIIETTIMIAFGAATVTSIAIDDHANILSTVFFPGSPGGTLWDAFLWDVGKWDSGIGSFYNQHPVYWDVPLRAKQLSVMFSGNCVGGFRIGNLSLRYQRLGYQVGIAA